MKINDEKWQWQKALNIKNVVFGYGNSLISS
jgi:hypothetical protein